MGGTQYSPKISYYKLFQKEIKNSYDYIQTSEFNQQYSTQMNKFIEEKKKKKKIIIMEDNNIDWKAFLLNKLHTNEINTWKSSLYNFIINDFDIKNEEIYKYENMIFIQQFILLSFPQIHLGDKDLKSGPILSLFSKEELKEYSEKSRKKSKKRTKKNVNKENSRLTIGTVLEGEINIEEQNLSDNQKKVEYNSYKIREHLNIIQRQLKEERHPINVIIKKFCEIYGIHIRNDLETLKIDKKMNEIEKKKFNVIKDIQTFIEIASVSLKVFYSKTINYKFFVSERDEFFNLICFILFNDKDFYNSIFELFELSNAPKTEDLLTKIKNLGTIYPKEAGVSNKFCLDEAFKKIRDKNESKEIEENLVIQKKKTGIVDFFEKIDFLKNRVSSFDDGRINMEIERDSKVGFIRSVTGDYTYYSSKKSKNVEIKEEKKEERHTIMSYKDFSEKINSPNTTLKEKYQEDLDENPSELHFPSIDEYNNTSKKPYGEVIQYISTMKNYNTPLDKLTIIALSSVLITDCVDNFWKDVKDLPPKYLNIDADQLMSIYLYIVYSMNLSSIYTQLDFINFFTGEKTKKSMIGYYYTTFDGCISFIMTANRKQDLLNNDNNI